MFQQSPLWSRHRRYTEALAASDKRDFSMLCREVQALTADLHSTLSRWGQSMCWQCLPFSACQHQKDDAIC